MYATYDEARMALEEMQQDVLADMGEEALEAGYGDIVHSIAASCTPEVAEELKRRML